LTIKSLTSLSSSSLKPFSAKNRSRINSARGEVDEEFEVEEAPGWSELKV